MLRRVNASILVGLLLAFIFTSNSLAATNQTTGSGDGLKVSPVRTDLTINPGQEVTVNVYIQNITPFTAQLKVIINNFTANGETGIPALYLKNTNVYNPHGLSQFIAPISNITVAPKQYYDVKVKIKIPANTLGGGYYGAVRFAPANTISNKSVSLSASVASLILVKVPGPNLVQRMNLSSFAVSQNNQVGSFFFSPSNINVVTKFDNTGNVQEEPFGKVILKNMNGRVLMTKEINNSTPPGNVLPSSIRAFSIPLKQLSSFGKYSVSGYFGYGSSGQLLSATTTFYVVSPWIIALAIIVILLVILAIWGMPKLFRAWYRRSIRSEKE